MSPADPDHDRGGGGSREENEKQRKRPEVEHYKPGAFTGRRAGSEDGRRPRSADSSVSSKGRHSGNYRGGRGGGRGRGGGGSSYGNGNKKKPDIEPYVPKKVQEQRDLTDDNTTDAGVSNSNIANKGDATPASTGTGRSKKKNKNKKNKMENKADTLEKKNKEKIESDKRSEKSDSKKTVQSNEKKEDSNKNKDLRETIENKKASKVSGSQSNPDFKTSRNDDINVKKVSQDNTKSNKKNNNSNNERYDYYDNRKKGNRHSYHESYDGRRDYNNGGKTRYGNDDYNSYQSGGNYKGNAAGGARDLRRGHSFGYDNERRGGRNKENCFKNFDNSRSNSPSSHNWNWKGGRGGRGGGGGGGNFSRGNSRVSSPSRSVRGNSPQSQSSRGNSRRNSPSNFSRTDSPVRHTQVFYRRNNSPGRGGRSTISRTPSPPHTFGRGGGSSGRGSAGGGSRTLGRHDRDRDRDRYYKKDSRDLEGWSRQDNFDRNNRGKEDLWDPRGKPPSGRPKSALAKTPLPPRFLKNKEAEDPRDIRDSRDRDVTFSRDVRDTDYVRSGHPASNVSMSSSWSGDRRRIDSNDSGTSKDVSAVSDWSVEVEEEDERRSLADCVTPMSDRQTVSPPSRGLSPVAGLIKLPDPMSNPHWRPPPDSRHPAWRDWRHSSAPATPSGGPPPARHAPPLYDPSHQSFPSNQRFPMEPSRFAAPTHMLPQNLSQGGGPGYRPPFPARFYPSQSGSVAINPPDWYDVYNANIYGSGKTDINCIAEIVRADMKLRSVLQGGPSIVCSRWDQEVRETRHKIMAAARYLIKNDIMFVAERDVETHIWKTVYYQVIELLKTSYLDNENTCPENRKTLKGCLINLFEEGVDYYTQLLADLSSTYRLDLDLYYDPLEPRDMGGDRVARLGIISAQKCNLCLGDLARYREQVNDGTSSNYGRARQYYTKANHLEMRNGRPFNMLAILAKMNNRKFEAVYYHVRCLSSRNAFQSSKEGLVSIFEEMKRRWEITEKKRVEERKEGEREREGRRIVRGSKVRKEIWEASESGAGVSRRLHRTTSAQSSGEDELASMSVADLNKRFINTFLYLQGKLYTQIDTDDFPVAQSNLLDQFRVLISKSPLPLSTDRLVQIMALNMFIIEETKMRSTDSSNSTYRSVCQDLALSLAGDMFGLLLERCNLLVARGEAGVVLEPGCQLEEDLCNLLAPVKVMCDWLLGNSDTWQPLVSSEPFAQLAQLATRLESIKAEVNNILDTCLSEKTFLAHPQARRDEFALIKLTEDSLLCEFSPWFRGLSWDTYRQYCPKNLSIPKATSAKRVSQILLAVEYLEGLDNPVLKWSLPDNSHVCLVSDNRDSTCPNREHVSRDMAVSNLTAMIARDEYILEESYSGEEEEDISEDKEAARTSTELDRLRERKEELEKARRKEQARARRAQREILNEVVSVTLHIKPKTIVPDTNILVDNLSDIQELAASGDWNIRLPTTVILELEGLARPGQDTRDRSLAALAWVRDKPGNTKCVTTKGSVLNSFSLAFEEDCSDGQKNDDRILQCCLNLNSSPAPTIEHGIKTVYRDTVLITDDRNLRLKAHTADCAVNSIKEFMNWIKSVKN